MKNLSLTLLFVAMSVMAMSQTFTFKNANDTDQQDPEPQQVETIIKREPVFDKYDYIDLQNIEKEKRGAGLLKIAGAAAITTAFIISSDFNNDMESMTADEVKSRVNTIKGLAIGGGVSMVLGFSIDIESDKKLIHLLKRKSDL